MSHISSLFSVISDAAKRVTPYFLMLLIILGGVYLGYTLVGIPDQWKLVVLITLLLFYPVCRYPWIGIFFIFAALPFIPYFRKLYYLVYQRPSADPLIMLGDIIVVLIMLGLYFVFRERREYDFGVRAFSRIIVIYIVYIVIRSVVLNELGPAEGAQRIRFYAPQVMMFFIGVVYAQHSKMLQKIWHITLVVAVCAALYGIKQLYFGYSEAERIWFSSISFQSLFIGGNARPFSLFQSPAAFADYMQIAIIGLFILSQSKNASSKLWLLFLPLFGYAILITSVRSNWAGLVLSIFVWFTFLNIVGTKKRIIFIAVLGLAFAVFNIWGEAFQVGMDPVRFSRSILGGTDDNQLLNVLITDRMGAVINPFEEHSMVSRITLWKYVFSYSVEPVNALLGRGTGALNSDSLFVTYLAEFGYPGLIFIIFLLSVLIYKGFYYMDRATDFHTRVLVKGITAFNITFFLMNITGTHIHAFPGDTYFWFFNGVLVKLTSIVGKEKVIGESAACNA